MKDQTNELFEKVHTTVLDYVDEDLVLRCAEWGHRAFLLLQESGVVEKKEDIGTAFLYALATGVIVGEFSECLFDDRHSIREKEFLLEDLKLDFNQVRRFLSNDLAEHTILEIEECQSVSFEHISNSIVGGKKDIYQVLFKKHEKDKNPEYSIYQSLFVLFESINEEGDVIMPQYAHWQEEGAFGCVLSHFCI